MKAVKGAVKIKPYQVATAERPKAKGGPVGVAETETLTGEVQGLPASDIEERFARALEKSQVVASFQFRVPYIAGRNLQGEVELDYAVYAPLLYPVQLDGEFAHKNAEQKERDRVQDARLDARLSGVAAAPVKRIPGDELETQALADDLVKEMFG